MNSLLVRKYGGSSLATTTNILSVAENLAALYNQGRQIIVVVSAMGKSTDELIRLAYSLSSRPAPRELDMLISTGERISMSLLSMALQELGCPAISFTGSQAGILTDASHTNARILDLKPVRVQEELRKKKIIVIAGFQGVCPVSKEVTTLGRGGSDTSAVALAAHFKAQRCEVLKDVPGVLSGDPKWGGKTKHLPELSFDHLYHMTFWGAKVLHHRSVALAERLGVPLFIGLAHGEGTSTLIQSEDRMYESAKVLATSHRENLLRLEMLKSSLHQCLERLSAVIDQHSLVPPERLHLEPKGDGWMFWLSAPAEHRQNLVKILRHEKFRVDETPWAALTFTGHHLSGSDLVEKLSRLLEKEKISIERLLCAPQGITLILPQAQLAKATELSEPLLP